MNKILFKNNDNFNKYSEMIDKLENFCNNNNYNGYVVKIIFNND